MFRNGYIDGPDTHISCAILSLKKKTIGAQVPSAPRVRKVLRRMGRRKRREWRMDEGRGIVRRTEIYSAGLVVSCGKTNANGLQVM